MKRSLRISEGSQADWTLICDDGKYCAWMDPKNISEIESAIAARIQDICKLDVSQIGYGDCTISFRDLTKDQAEDILFMFLHGADYFEDIDINPKAFEKCRYSMFRSR